MMEVCHDDDDFTQYLKNTTRVKRRRRKVFSGHTVPTNSSTLSKVCKKSAASEIKVTDASSTLIWQFLKQRNECMSEDQVAEVLTQLKSAKTEKERQNQADYLFKFKQPSTIIPGQLYLGPALDFQELKNYTAQHDIKNIISITGKPNEYDYSSLGFQEIEYDDQNMIQNYQADGKNYLRLECNDTETSQISDHFDISYQFIAQCLSNQEKVYIHCKQGISRSTTLLAYYLLRHDKNEYDSCQITDVNSCLEFIRSRRPLINPNRGFVKTLEKLFNGDSEDSGNGSNFSE